MNQPIEKLPTVWQLLDERDQLKKKLQEQALTYLSLDTQNQLLYEENQKLKSDVTTLRRAVLDAKNAFDTIAYYNYARNMEIVLATVKESND
jgi:hypothetical protein